MIKIDYGYTDCFIVFDVWSICPKKMIYRNKATFIRNMFDSKNRLIMNLIDKNCPVVAYMLLSNNTG